MELKVGCHPAGLAVGRRRIRQRSTRQLDRDLYVELSGEDALEYQRLLALQRNKEIRQMDQTWLGKAEARGISAAGSTSYSTTRSAVAAATVP